jgi:hypothetical protein
MDMMWGINGFHMDDPMKRVLMRPPLGTIEKYVLKSAGMGMGMGMMGGAGASNGGMMSGDIMGGEMARQELVDSGKYSAHRGGGDKVRKGMMGGEMMGVGMMGHGSHHGGMMSMAKTKAKRRVDIVSVISMAKGKAKSRLETGLRRLGRRQMEHMGGVMMGGGMMNMENSWTHAMHFHLVVRFSGTRLAAPNLTTFRT